MTEGTPWKLILLFALPLMAGHALQQLYNTVDGIVVGNFVSSEALGAVGTCASLVMLFLCFAVGMSTGSAVVISQFYGANRYEDMRRAVSTCMIMMVGLGIVLTVIGEFTEASEGAKTIGLDGITRPMPAPSADEIYKI